LAETYPAECYRQVLSLKGRFSKQRRDDRAACAPDMLRLAEGLALAPEGLGDAIRRGFYDADGADNGFDAAVGLLAMLAVLRGRRGEVRPRTRPRCEQWKVGCSGSTRPGLPGPPPLPAAHRQDELARNEGADDHHRQRGDEERR
jgi:hypothetical protein